MFTKSILGKFFVCGDTGEIRGFIGLLLHNFITCESSYGGLVTWLCGSLFLHTSLLVIESVKRSLQAIAGYG